MTEKALKNTNKTRISTADEALAAYRRSDYESAAKLFTVAIEEDFQVKWMIKRCGCYQQLKMDSDAIKDAKTIIKTNPENYKGYGMLGQIYASLGETENALFSFLDSLEIIWISGLANKEFKKVLVCVEKLVRTASAMVVLPDNINEQAHLTQLYIIGNSLQREARTALAIRTFEIALIASEREASTEDLTSNDMLKMKLYSSHAQCLQLTGKFPEAIDGFKQSLAIALKIGDISCETKTCLNLASLCIDQNQFAEAASYYIRLLAIADDVNLAVSRNKEKFREHWSVEMESSIFLNLCISYKSLRLYHEALEYAKKYDDLVTNESVTPTPTPLFRTKLLSRSQSLPATRIYSGFSTKSVDNSGLLQSKFILGDLHELIGDLECAMKHYKEWYNLSKHLGMTAPDGSAYALDCSSALSCQGNVLMKQDKYSEALDCFIEQANICRAGKANAPLMEALISQGDALAKMKRLEEARSKFQDALKISRKMVDDFVPECFCMWKLASVFAAERRYTHASYHCEKALNLGLKSGNKAMIKKLEYEQAMYFQHSSSKIENLKAYMALHSIIKYQEENILTHHINGGRYLQEEEDMLFNCYAAVQVIMYKIGQPEVSLMYGERSRMREINTIKNIKMDLPEVTAADNEKDRGDTPEPTWLKHPFKGFNNAVKGSSIVITYTLVNEGILVHVINPGVGIVQSYFSAEQDTQPHLTKDKITKLIENIVCGKKSTQNEISNDLRNLYHTENRCIQNKSDNFNLIRIKEGSKPERNRKAMVDVLAMGEGTQIGTYDKTVLESISNLNFTDTCEMLYSILISPVEKTLLDEKEGCNIVIIPDRKLTLIPFDCLINPDSKKMLCERFNVTTCPAIHLLASASESIDQPSSKTNNKSDKELLKSFKDQRSIKSLKASGLSKNFSKLVTNTATGNNVIISPRYIAPFRQSHTILKATSIGHPQLPEKLEYENGTWSPALKIPLALAEIKKVAEYFDSVCISGNDATKKSFMHELSSATVLHISTYADLRKGYLAFSPNTFPACKGSPKQISYLVTGKDIISTDCSKLRLVVLSSGQNSTTNRPDQKICNLAKYFLAAGTQCVIQQLWSVPSEVVNVFYFHFYQRLQEGWFVVDALNKAKNAVRKKYSNPRFSNCFIALGSNVYINLSEIRVSQLHAKLNDVESETLDIPNPVDEVESEEEIFNRLQVNVARLSGFLSGCNNEASIVGLVIELLEEAMDRLTADSNTNRPVVTLPAPIAQSKDAIGLLHLLGFAFQPTELDVAISHDINPGVLFPHWNRDGLLLPTHQALTGLQDICVAPNALNCLARILPLSQTDICSIIDLLAVSRHTPEVQLSIHDVGVKPVWNNDGIQEFLKSIGFVAVHSLLVFYKTSANRTLLIASLQFFASLSLYRDQQVLENLNISTLGTFPRDSETTAKKHNLSSVGPIVLPRNEVLITGSWLGKKIDKNEELERKSLAKKIGQVKMKYEQTMQHAKWWHNNLFNPQAQIKLNEYGSPAKEKPLKRKVLTGGTPSCQRVSLESPTDEELNEQRKEKFIDTMKKRDYVHYLASESYKEINMRMQAEVQHLFREYVKE